jgi:hypothetical protein
LSSVPLLGHDAIHTLDLLGPDLGAPESCVAGSCPAGLRQALGGN